MACEIQVDESAAASDGILLVHIRPYLLAVLGIALTAGSSVGFVRCFAPFDSVPYDKICLDDGGRSAFLPLVLTLFAGAVILCFFVSWDDFRFDRRAGTLEIRRRRPFRDADEETHDLRDIREVKVGTSDSGETSRVELRTDRATVPLTSWYSSDRSGHNRAAVAIERFLGLESDDEVRGLVRVRCCDCCHESRQTLGISDVEAVSNGTDFSSCVSAIAVPVRGEECAKLVPMAVATPTTADENVSVSKRHSP